MGCGSPIKKALEGLKNVKKVTMRFKDKQFDVEFVPDVSPKQLFDAVHSVRKSYKVSLVRPISAKVDDASLLIEATVDMKSYKKGSKGKIRIFLRPKSGQAVKGAIVSISADDSISLTKTEKKFSGNLKKNDSVLVPFKVSKKSAEGLHKITVEVKLQSRTIKVAVPVYSK